MDSVRPIFNRRSQNYIFDQLIINWISNVFFCIEIFDFFFFPTNFKILHTRFHFSTYFRVCNNKIRSSRPFCKIMILIVISYRIILLLVCLYKPSVHLGAVFYFEKMNCRIQSSTNRYGKSMSYKERRSYSFYSVTQFI